MILESLRVNSRAINWLSNVNDVGSARADKRGQVINWLSNVKDAVYVADDIIDDYDYEIIRREREQKKQFVKKFRAYFSRNNNPIVFRFRMSHKVRDALAAFDDLQKKAQDMGLKQLKITAGTSANYDEGSERLSQARQHASANEAEFVGREDEMKELIEKMCSPSNEKALISTVAILGLGGLGKTTFARCLYHSKDIEAHFEKKLWITVSDNFTIQEILKEMLEYVPSNKGNMSNIAAMISELQENLKNKKYLLVLDDVWCKDQELWSSLKNALQRIGGPPGCLILITTRLKEVTTGSQAVYTHSLRALSQGEGWALLKQRALGEVTYPNISEFEEIGKRIVEKCKGVPLAIKAIGGILQSKQLPSEWELIEKSEIWDLPQNDENHILPSLRLTFDHLPYPSLKQCFAYCAAFCRKGSLMKKDELVYIWLAQGFLDGSDLDGSEIKNLTMEEIGEKYLKDLLNYSLLDEVNGEEPRYKMHDLVYDLAVDVSGKDLLFWKPEDRQKIDSCRHLVIDRENVEALSNLPIRKTLMKLRTICNGLPHNVLDHAKYLRTRSVDDCDILELPSSIGLLTHLRFLSLSNNPIETLPGSIRKLYLLQTLRLLDCSDMLVLPAVLYRLTNLIHVPTTTFMFACRGLRELTNLHTLPHISLVDCDYGWSIDELGGLQNLMGEIHISGLEQVKTKENCPELETPDFSNSSVNHVSFPSLIELEIARCGALKTCVPSPSADATNVFPCLEVLKVTNCPELETLPTLNSQSLKKVEIKNLGIRSFSIASPTANMKLEILEIRDCEKLVSLPSSLQFAASLKNLTVAVCPALTSFPNDLFQGLASLSKLSIWRCEKLVSLPSEVQFVASLKTVKVINCPALTSLPNDLFNGLASLSDLRISRCEALSNIPTSLEKCVSLATLMIKDCPSVKGPTPDFSKLKGLQKLYKSGNSIELMISLLKAVQHLPNLTTLYTGKFSDEEEQELYFADVSPILQNQSLRKLYLYGSPNIKSLPEQLQLLTQIKSLWIWDFDDLEELPEWVGRLSSLEELWLFNCKKLKDIPSKEVFLQMTRLRQLSIWSCPILAESCVKDVGSDWTKISHIPFIEIDFKVLVQLEI
ncbi:putative disease resistance protein RGA3 [Silene latifolia]|uniref:putative disease resistance protein RGA3 n=1 Tax=Silene latifolia TaxID=37657 RepID=UPI003D779ABC